MATLTRRQTLAAALAVAALPRLVWAQETREIVEMTMGSPDAPVTLVEYAMFNCPHCAAFTRDVFPKIKENYIDTGKVRLVYREVYFNKPSLWAAMIARCAPSDRYFGIVELLYQKQNDWAMQSDANAMLSSLFSIGRQAGMTDDQMNACLQDRGFAEALVAEYQKNAEADKIEATPTFFINGQREDNMTYEAFAAKLDAALGA
jgi:protein-disulfide isomerase